MTPQLLQPQVSSSCCLVIPGGGTTGTFPVSIPISTRIPRELPISLLILVCSVSSNGKNGFFFNEAFCYLFVKFPIKQTAGSSARLGLIFHRISSFAWAPGGHGKVGEEHQELQFRVLDVFIVRIKGGFTVKEHRGLQVRIQEQLPDSRTLTWSTQTKSTLDFPLQQILPGVKVDPARLQ